MSEKMKVVRVSDYLKTKNGGLHDEVRKSMKEDAAEAKKNAIEAKKNAKASGPAILNK